MTIETLEQAEAAQQQIEDFARSAHAVKIAVERLKHACLELADLPDSIDEAMVELIDAAETVAKDARDWAAESNANFDPSSERFNHLLKE